MPKYDIVIIGSGLGGLICANMLSKEGYNVCVIEKNKQLGGCLQTFKRNDCIFDTGIHFVGSLDKGQILNRFFNYFGIMDKLKLKRLDEDGFNVIHFNNKEYKHAMGYERFKEELLQQFPNENKSLDTYIHKLNEVVDSMNLYNLREIENNNLIDNSYITSSAFDFLNSCSDNFDLKSVLAGANSLYAGIPDKTSLYIHALINHSFIQSSWRLVDGSDQISDLLAETIIANGGTILKNSKVEELVFENDKIKFAKLSNGELIEGTNFISNVHPAVTMEMVDQNKIRPAYRHRIMNIENTISNFTVYIVLKKNSFKYQNYNYYHHNSNNVWGANSYSTDKWPDSYMLLTSANSKSDEWADSLILLSYMTYEEVKKWENTTVEKRGQEYLDFKHQKAETLIDLVEQKYPNLRNCIETYYTSTPLTYRDYTATKEGSLYGIERDCRDPLKSYVPSKTKIPNLYFTGQNINLHGAIGVAIGSMLTCGEFVGLNNLIKKIADET